MNKEKYNQIIDEAYENYCKEYEKDNSVGMILLVKRVDGKSVYRKPDLEMFITLCTFDKTFSERWELKIEERELSNKERVKLSWFILFPDKEKEVPEWWNIRKLTMDGKNIPTKLITVTYKDEKIEVYE